jgi:hypothetical protein
MTFNTNPLSQVVTAIGSCSYRLQSVFIAAVPCAHCESASTRNRVPLPIAQDLKVLPMLVILVSGVSRFLGTKKRCVLTVHITCIQNGMKMKPQLALPTRNHPVPGPYRAPINSQTSSSAELQAACNHKPFSSSLPYYFYSNQLTNRKLDLTANQS